jgi:hypothetical protein
MMASLLWANYFYCTDGTELVALMGTGTGLRRHKHNFAGTCRKTVGVTVVRQPKRRLKEVA